MEQAAAQYWMLMKRKQEIVKNNTNKVLHSRTCNEETSWEERAFERDHAAVMWPPRSYSCTFCKREFRSAQALGGHMNVHRRDRARLKQSLNLDPIPSSRVSSTSHGNAHVSHDHDHACRSWSSSGGGPGFRVQGAVRVLRVDDDHEEEGEMGSDLSVGLMMGCKRPKLASPSLQFSLKPCLQASDINIGFKASSIEDLDLELRLGHDPQQVK